MDKDPLDIESQLANLEPREPSSRLRERLAAELDEAPVDFAAESERLSTNRPRRSFPLWRWDKWTIAAVLVVMLGLASNWMPRGGDSVAPAETTVAQADDVDVLRPVRAARTLIKSSPEGIVELPDGSPVERIRDYFVDTIEWRDGNGEALLRWELPRESVRFVALASY